ncbi:hypothetical protein [Massilia sp. DD77]|uniref:hypothetical protein n=1 Tax=Massilia sp. DD77 TaxID=3109349 RepID=UPI002FFE2978
MTRQKAILISGCDTHHALFGETHTFRYLDGFLLSHRYIFAESTARRLFDKDGEAEQAGVPLSRIIGIFRQQYGTEPWFICEQCADYLGLDPVDKKAAHDATLARLASPNVVGHLPAIDERASPAHNVLAIGYSSRLIPTKDEMASLTVFYDQIWLPHPCDLSPRGTKNLASVFRQIAGANYEIPNLQAARDRYAAACGVWQPLFDAGILKIMPPFEILAGLLGDNDTISLTDYADWHMRLPKEASRFERGVSQLESLILALHRLDAKKTHPELFISNPNDKSTARLSGFLNQAIVAARIPMLATLDANQILDLRESVNQAKDGYRQYLYQLTDDLEQRLSSGDKTEVEAARKTAERKIIPEYANYVRQLKALEIGFGARILEAGGKFLQIDAAPWTPKFWGAILECFSAAIATTAEHDKEIYLSNEKQAFHYLATIERNVAGP